MESTQADAWWFTVRSGKFYLSMRSLIGREGLSNTKVETERNWSAISSVNSMKPDVLNQFSGYYLLPGKII